MSKVSNVTQVPATEALTLCNQSVRSFRWDVVDSMTTISTAILFFLNFLLSKVYFVDTRISRRTNFRKEVQASSPPSMDVLGVFEHFESWCLLRLTSAAIYVPTLLSYVFPIGFCSRSVIEHH